MDMESIQRVFLSDYLFDRECFLPVLKDIKQYNLIKDFEILNKNSFLSKVYEQIKGGILKLILKFYLI